MSDQFPSPFKARLFTSWGFLYRALLIIFVFAMLHLAGLREYTSFITGTTSGGYLDLLGMTYFIFYALAVFLAPILLLAAGLLALLERFWPQVSRQSEVKQ